MIRVKGTSITGELICAVDDQLIVDTAHGPQYVPAMAAEVVPGGEDEEMERSVVADAAARPSCEMR